MKKFFILICGMLLLSGCGPYVPFRPSTGFIYTDVTAPLMLDNNKTRMVDRSGNTNSYYVDFRGLSLAIGDNSLERALDRGHLKDAAYADYRYISVLGLFERWSVNAYGTR